MSISLKDLNTFGIAVTCPALYEINHKAQIAEYQKLLTTPHMILGGGSNVLFTKNLDIPVLVVKNQGIQVEQESQTEVWVRVGAGVVWDELVVWAIKNDLAGIENLSLIPGRVGAASIQNIGAYGVEFSSVLLFIIAWDKLSREFVQLSAAECQLGYRESVFKSAKKDRYIITEVVIRLFRTSAYKPNITYGSVLRDLQTLYYEPFTINQIRKVIVSIRNSKLPNPKVTGNAGSFFKNPTVPMAQFLTLQKQFPEVVCYPVSGGVKLAAGWLIEQAGWKGYRKGDAGCHLTQALVLVNYGNAAGTEIAELALQIQQDIQQKFGVLLEPEVNVY